MAMQVGEAAAAKTHRCPTSTRRRSWTSCWSADHLPDHRSGRDPDDPGPAAEGAIRAHHHQAGERQPLRQGGPGRAMRGLLEPDHGCQLAAAARTGGRRARGAVASVGGAQNITEENMPEAHIRADINTPYRCVGGAIFTMQRAGYRADRLHLRAASRAAATGSDRRRDSGVMR